MPQLGIDAIICHHGQAGNFYGSYMFNGLGDRFLEQGCAVLRVNSRGHDLVFNSPRGRQGAACEIVDECRQDWKAWLDYAESLGYRRIAVWGQSLGAVKTVYWLALENDPRVVCAVASSPPRFNYAASASGEGGEAFKSDIEKARALTESGQGDSLLPVRGGSSFFAARSYYDKYGPADRYDYFRHLSGVQVPLLITLGGAEDSATFQELIRRGPALNGEFPRVSFERIEGADHSYMTRIPELWKAARRFIESVAAPSAVGQP
jgi:dienelactone hydrolase